MMTAAQQRDILAGVTCFMMDGWLLTYHDVGFGRPYIQMNFYAFEYNMRRLKVDPTKRDWTGRKWYLSERMTETEIVNTCYKAWQAALEHEFREHFRYQGATIYNPHRSVASLVRAARSADAIDCRTDSMQGAS